MEGTKLIRKESDLAPFPDVSLTCHVPWSKPLPAAGLQLSLLCLSGLCENKSLALEERRAVSMQRSKAVGNQLQTRPLSTLVYPSHFAIIEEIIFIIPIGVHEKTTVNLLLCLLRSCTLNDSISNIKKKINLFFLHGNYYFKCYFISALKFFILTRIKSSDMTSVTQSFKIFSLIRNNSIHSRSLP